MLRNRFLSDYGFVYPIPYSIKNYLGEKMGNEKEEWKKVETEIFRFDDQNKEISGELVSVEDSNLYNNKVYKIKKQDGKVYTVFGTTVLDTQMQNVALHKKVKIVYTGEKPNPKQGQADIKLFDVYIK
jgi:hypothetical protein